MNLLQNIMENFLDVKLALTPWVKVLFCLWAEGEKLTEEEGFL
jgi:hypothetical protein